MALSTTIEAPADESVPSPDRQTKRAGRFRAVARAPWFWLVVVVVAGGALRFVGLAWGLPLHLHPDEWVVVDGAIDLAKRHSFEPKYFMRPDHLEIKLNYLAYELYGHLLHGTPPEVLFARDQSRFYLIARMNTAIMGVLCIPVAYLIASRLRPSKDATSAWTGVLAAALFAFYPPFVQNAHYATPDVPLVLTSLLVVLGCVLYIDSPRWRWLLLATFAVALGVIAKYPAALGGVIVAGSVVVAGVRDRAWRRTLLHGLVTPAFFLFSVFLLSPVLFTNLSAVRASLGTESGSDRPGADGLGFLGNLHFYVKVGWPPLGLILSIFAVLGGARLIRDGALRAMPVLLGVVMWVGLSSLPLHWSRWGLPMYVTPLLLAPVGAYACADWLGRATRSARYGRPAIAALVAIALVSMLATSLSIASSFRVPDERRATLADFEAKGITKDNAISEGYSPFLPGAPLAVFDRFTLADGRLMVRPTKKSRTARYVVLSSVQSRRYMSDKVRFASELAIYSAIRSQFALVGRWSPDDVQPVPSTVELRNIPRQIGYLLGSVGHERRVGPTITVYRIPESARGQG